MKVLYLHQYFATPDSSGGTRSYEMAKRMIAAGHEVTFVTSSAFLPKEWVTKKGWNHFDYQGIKVVALHLPYSNSVGFTKRMAIFFEFSLRSLLMSRSIRCDVVFATSTPLTIAIPGVYAARKNRVPFVFEVRDLWPELPVAVGAIRSRLFIEAARRLEKWAYFNANEIVALSPGMAEGVIATGYPRARVSVISNSCDNALFRVGLDDIRSFRNQYDWLQSRPLVLYAGTLGVINGVSYLAELAAETWKLNPEIRFLVVGSGREESLVRDRARQLGVYEKNFYMMAPVTKNDMPVFFGAATVAMSLFIPLEPMWNNSANKFFDALASSTAVAINYRGWQEGVLEKSGAGFTLSHNDFAMAARDLVEYIGDAEFLESASVAARDLASNEFDRDVLARKLCDALARAVS